MKKLVFFVIAWLLNTPCVHAEDNESSSPSFNISGFGTLGAVYHDTQGARYRRDISQGSSVGAGQLSFKSDSMIGIQLDTVLSPSMQATLQTVSRQNWEGHYTPQVTMAYLKLAPTDNVFFRAGRLIIETYLQGDSAEVGYANLQIRQPIIFVPRGFDGMDAETSRPFADGVLRLKGAAGWTYGHVSDNTGQNFADTGGSQIITAVVEYMRQSWTWHAAAGRLKLHDEIEGLKDGALFPTALLAAAPNGASVLDKLRQKNREFYYWSLASAYDQGPMQVSASYSAISSEDWPTRHLFFINGGYRIKNVTPYASFASQHTTRDIIATGLPSSSVLDQQASLAQGRIMLNQTDFALGARYDFAQNIAFKLQADHIRYRDPESIIDTAQVALPSEMRRYKTFNLFSLALDFVF